MDFGARPPEVNSGLIYAGPGSGPLLASAAAWTALAAELGSTGAAYAAVIAALNDGPWLGPSSLTMAAAAAPFLAWMEATAAQCSDAAAQASAAATAFEEAFAGVVPPAEIETNRNTLSMLVASNWFGQNFPGIATTEGIYNEMWAQDAGAMYGYAGQSAAAASLVPFVPPLPNTDPAGLAAQAAAVGQASGDATGTQSQKIVETSGQAATGMQGMDAQALMSAGPQLMQMVPQLLQGFAQPLQGAAQPLSSLGQFQSLLSPVMGAFSNPAAGTSGLDGAGAALAAPALGGLGSGGGGLGVGGLGGGGAAVSAALGRAGSIGGLSVPATWAANAPASASVAAELPMGSAAPATTAAGPGPGGMYGGGMPMAAGATGAGGRGGSDNHRYGTPITVVPRTPAGAPLKGGP
ncbi:MAG: PPE family protein [Mycobacteriaceae bacterium]|nr:PPE family protein [Mycobacteriaceae bacterium]MBV9638443.1 PPE family protein [Mycobacteriaceae bacterium]